jgi:hypothetical protein
MSHLCSHLAQGMIDEELRVARDCQRTDARDEPLQRAGGVDAHERQRALVRASLRLSRWDPATRSPTAG